MKSKVLFILHTPPPVHGSSVVGKAIKDSPLINNAFECRYINLGTSHTLDEIGKNPLRKIWRYFSILWQVFIQLIKFKPNLCYIAITAKGGAFYKDALIALMVKTFDFKIVYHFHNKGVSTRQNKAFDDFLYKLVFRKTKAILLSKYLYPDISKYFSKQDVFYCPNGIPENKTYVSKKSLKTENKTIQILFLSNLIKSKGIYVLLEALKILKDRNLPFKAVIVGGEGDITASQLNEKIHNLDLNEQVKYIGKKFGTEKALAYKQANIFVFPTYYETFGLVNLEAMQFSLPIISTFEGGIPDIVADGVNGFLVPQKDVKALAEKLETLIKNPDLRQKMGEEGRKIYKQKFTLEVFEKNLANILSRIKN